MSRVKIGINDIQTVNPNLAKEWDVIKNSPLIPEHIAAHSNKKYWWKCEGGHSWEATPNNRSNGFGCPYCSGRLPILGENDLFTVMPLLSAEWDYEKNKSIDPKEVSAQSNKNYWWKCKHGHSWKNSPSHRYRGDGCPYCSNHRVFEGFNDLLSSNPGISKEWDYEKNYPLEPNNVTSFSSKKVWWRCSEGHEWKATIAHRNGEGLGCPYCSGRYAIKGKTDLATKNPYFIKEWNYEKNVSISPQEVTQYSEKKVWWKCTICNHEWAARIAARSLHGTGCPNCDKRNKTSFPEQAIFFYANKFFPDSENSYTDIFSNGMELDIFIPSLRIGIEYDGYRHKGKQSDEIKYQICREKKIKLIRVSEVGRESKEKICDVFLESKYLSPNNDFNDTLCELFCLLGVKEHNIDYAKDKVDIYKQYLSKMEINSVATACPEIALEWNYEKNKGLTPEMFNRASATKVWWKCVNGHEWESSIASRTVNGAGCIICAKQKIRVGQVNAKIKSGGKLLFDLCPELKEEWDYKKNVFIDTSCILAYSSQKVWWKCANGHEWMSVIQVRAKGSKCPWCYGYRAIPGKSDLFSERPELEEIWNYEKNGHIEPTKLKQHSNKKVWWKCTNGHEWEAVISSVAYGRRCPYCSGRRVLTGYNDLKTLREDLLKEWNYDKNREISPEEVTEHSGKKVWWRCAKGHEWKAVIDSRARGHRCPTCFQMERKYR